MRRTVPCLFILSATLPLLLAAPQATLAQYRGTGPACVSGLGEGARLGVFQKPDASSRSVGSLAPGQCGMNIESVEGTWTYIRGSSGGRNIQGWVNNRFLAAKPRAPRRGTPQRAGGFPMRAASGGGIVRAGPGTNFRRQDSLRPFEPLTVTGNTGVMFNGYPWFAIRYRGGRTGYQWGGIVCSLDRPLPGTFDTCANARKTLGGNNTGGSNSTGNNTRGNGQRGDNNRRTRVSYSCNEGIPLIVTFVEQGNRSFALYSHDSGPNIRVDAQRTGSGFAYSNGFHTLRGKGKQISLIEGGKELDRCTSR